MASKDLLNLLDNAVAALSSEKHTLARNQYAIAGRRPVSAADASTNTYGWSDADTGGVALLTHSLAKLSADHEQALSELLRVSASESSAKKELQAMRARLASAEDGLDEVTYQKQQDDALHEDAQLFATSEMLALQKEQARVNAVLEQQTAGLVERDNLIGQTQAKLVRVEGELMHAKGQHAESVAKAMATVAAVERGKSEAEEQVAKLAGAAHNLMSVAEENLRQVEEAHETALIELQGKMSKQQLGHNAILNQIGSTNTALEKDIHVLQSQLQQSKQSTAQALHRATLAEDEITTIKEAMQAAEQLMAERLQQASDEANVMAQKAVSQAAAALEISQQDLSDAKLTLSSLEAGAATAYAMDVQTALDKVRLELTETSANMLVLEAERGAEHQRAEQAEQAAAHALDQAALAEDKLSAYQLKRQEVDELSQQRVQQLSTEASHAVRQSESHAAAAAAAEVERLRLELAGATQTARAAALQDAQQSFRDREHRLETRVTELLDRTAKAEAEANAANTARKVIEDELTSKVQEQLLELDVAMKQEKHRASVAVDERLTGVWRCVGVDDSTQAVSDFTFILWQAEGGHLRGHTALSDGRRYTIEAGNYSGGVDGELCASFDQLFLNGRHVRWRVSMSAEHSFGPLSLKGEWSGDQTGQFHGKKERANIWDQFSALAAVGISGSFPSHPAIRTQILRPITGASSRAQPDSHLPELAAIKLQAFQRGRATRQLVAELKGLQQELKQQNLSNISAARSLTEEQTLATPALDNNHAYDDLGIASIYQPTDRPASVAIEIEHTPLDRNEPRFDPSVVLGSQSGFVSSDSERCGSRTVGRRSDTLEKRFTNEEIAPVSTPIECSDYDAEVDAADDEQLLLRINTLMNASNGSQKQNERQWSDWPLNVNEVNEALQSHDVAETSGPDLPGTTSGAPPQWRSVPKRRPANRNTHVTSLPGNGSLSPTPLPSPRELARRRADTRKAAQQEARAKARATAARTQPAPKRSTQSKEMVLLYP